MQHDDPEILDIHIDWIQQEQPLNLLRHGGYIIKDSRAVHEQHGQDTV